MKRCHKYKQELVNLLSYRTSEVEKVHMFWFQVCLKTAVFYVSVGGARVDISCNSYHCVISYMASYFVFSQHTSDFMAHLQVSPYYMLQVYMHLISVLCEK